MAELLDGPYSPVTYSAYADWLEERGMDDWADAWRLIVAKRLEPSCRVFLWGWDLPVCGLAHRWLSYGYTSPGAAVAALVGAVQRLDRAARAKLWDWTPTSSTTP